MKPGDFWRAFVQLLPQLEKALDDDLPAEHIVALVDEHVDRLGDFGWEVGPFRSGYLFSLSAGDDRDLERQADELISVAPAVNRWHFFSGKPPRDGWVPRFFVYESEGGKHLVDATAARFRFHEQEAGRLQLKGIDFGLAPPSLQRDAIEILLDGVIGERRRRALVSVDVVGDETAGVFRPLEDLDGQC